MEKGGSHANWVSSKYERSFFIHNNEATAMFIKNNFLIPLGLSPGSAS